MKRDPESRQVIEHFQGVSNFDQLISILMESEEFISRYVCSFPTEKWVRVNISDTDNYIYVDLSDNFVSKGCLFSNYEYNESQFVRSVVKPNDIVLDIGANIGWFTIMMAKLVGNSGHVHAFEPRPTTFEYLNMSIGENRLFKNTTLYKVALDDVPGEAYITWRPTDRNPGNSWISQHDSDVSFKQDRVTTCRLDDMGIQHVSFIKIDVEGAEPGVFKGGAKLIARDKPTILSEINFDQLRRISAMDWKDYKDFLVGIGYDAFYLVDGKGASSVADAMLKGIDVVSIAMWPSDRNRHLKPQNIWE